MINMEPTSTKQNLDSLYQSWKKNQRGVEMTSMLDFLNNDIDKAVYAYSGLNAGPAVKSKAKLLAVKAIKNFDPKSNSSLRSWVYTQLQPLSRYTRELSPSPMPERTLQQLSALKRYESEFYENKGRVASDSELADLVGISLRQINKIRGMDKKTYSENFNAFVGENPVTTQELIATPNDQAKQDILATMYSSLTAPEQVILEHKLGYNNKKILSNNDIARKLKISAGRVSQLTSNLVSKLEEYSEISQRSP